MSELYNEPSAKHYSAFRPPLHNIILEQALKNSSQFSDGLDIGCGTGYSARALSEFCSRVVGIDPSQSMLDRADQHSNIKYIKGSGEQIPLPEDSVDIITFAGSLFYTDLKKVAIEIRRVGRKNARIISYDFKLILDDILSSLSIPVEVNDSDYDHTINFSGQNDFEELAIRQKQISLELLGDQLAHVLLSEHHLYKKFCAKYSADDPFDALKKSLVKSDNHFFIKANIYYSVYRLADS